MSVSKADGTPCYSFEKSLHGGEVNQYVWRDASGQVIATGTDVPFVVACEGGGETSTCTGFPTDPTANCCPVAALGDATCHGGGFDCADGVCR